jgi:hypothetical protein
VAEGARLESVFAGNRNAGSNPAPSANTLFANSHKRPINPIKTSHIRCHTSCHTGEHHVLRMS